MSHIILFIEKIGSYFFVYLNRDKEIAKFKTLRKAKKFCENQGLKLSEVEKIKGMRRYIYFKPLKEEKY